MYSLKHVLFFCLLFAFSRFGYAQFEVFPACKITHPDTLSEVKTPFNLRCVTFKENPFQHFYIHGHKANIWSIQKVVYRCPENRFRLVDSTQVYIVYKWQLIAAGKDSFTFSVQYTDSAHFTHADKKYDMLTSEVKLARQDIAGVGCWPVLDEKTRKKMGWTGGIIVVISLAIILLVVR
jgi:hypothetical protein